MKKILWAGMLGLLLCVSCTEQYLKEDFVTACEKSRFVKTPRLSETMDYFRNLADYSPMVIRILPLVVLISQRPPSVDLGTSTEPDVVSV